MDFSLTDDQRMLADSLDRYLAQRYPIDRRHAAATTPQGEPVFNARLTPVCVARPERRSIDIPPAFRQALLDYQRDCGMPTPSTMPSQE